MITIVIVAAVALLVGAYAGPVIRIFTAQIISETKAEYEKEKAVIEADLATAKANLVALGAKADSVIAGLQSDLAASEAKVKVFNDLFATAKAASVAQQP